MVAKVPSGYQIEMKYQNYTEHQMKTIKKVIAVWWLASKILHNFLNPGKIRTALHQKVQQLCPFQMVLQRLSAVPFQIFSRRYAYQPCC